MLGDGNVFEVLAVIKTVAHALLDKIWDECANVVKRVNCIQNAWSNSSVEQFLVKLGQLSRRTFSLRARFVALLGVFS